MSIQETFDKVAKHLFKQNERCATTDENSHNACHYEKDGLRCAIGVLIPDNHDGLTFFGDIGSLLEEHPDLKKPLGIKNYPDDESFQILSDLQEIHDGDEPEHWPKELFSVSRHYELKWNFPEMFQPSPQDSGRGRDV